MSKEIIENITKLDNNLVSTFVDPHLLLDMDFNGDCLIKSDISIRTKVINLHISYTLGPQLGNLNINFTLVNCLFRSVKLNKNADIGKYKYSGCGIGFDSRSDFYLQMEAMKKMSLILEMIQAHLCQELRYFFIYYQHNKGQNILILGKVPIQGLDGITLTAEAKYPINFTQSRKRFVLSLHYIRSNSFLFANATKLYQFKVTKDAELNNYALCLGNS